LNFAVVWNGRRPLVVGLEYRKSICVWILIYLDYTTLELGGEGALPDQRTSRTSMSNDLVDCHFRRLGRAGAQRLWLPLRRIGLSIERSRSGVQSPLRHQWGSNVRMSGSRSRHLWRFFLVRLLLEHVF
jgi:hypothetical protein